jgi:excisionase family DNA binding protein
MSTNVSVSEAARVLRVSRRTIDRRIASGKLSTVDVDGARYVVLEDTEVAHALAKDKPAHVSDMERMRMEMDDLRTDRDRWAAHAQDLQRNVSELTATLYRVTEQKAIAAPIDRDNDEQRPPQRAWWQFWVR